MPWHIATISYWRFLLSFVVTSLIIHSFLYLLTDSYTCSQIAKMKRLFVFHLGNAVSKYSYMYITPIPL